MRQAIRLAMEGRGRVEPNPMVGCVIVKAGRVIGRGIHAEFGGPHAEPTALANCTESPEGATAYVTLEPCCHTNKKTPPCAPRLIAAKIARVVIGCLDPNPDVNGKGVAKLRAAGIQVDGPVLEPAAKQLAAPFLANVQHQRPYVTLKWAESADGKIAGTRGARMQISNPISSALVLQLRGRSDVVLVGVDTVLKDDPLLSAREHRVRPVVGRAVLDTHARTPPTAKLVQTPGEGWVKIFVGGAANADALDRIAGLERAASHVAITSCPTGPDGRISLPAAMEALHALAASHVLVEPGPTLAASFFAANLADRVWVFQSPREIRDDSAPKAAPVPPDYVKTGQLDLAGDTLTEYLNPASPVFFAAEPSADFVRAAEQQSNE